MKFNWKVRFRNKTWVGLLLAFIISFVFNMLKMFEIQTPVTENQVLNIVNQVLGVLGLVGILVDPTTEGIGDSDRAMTYDEPWVDPPKDDEEE